MYNESSFTPSKLVEVLGVVSRSSLPLSGEDEEITMVPAIHVVCVSEKPTFAKELAADSIDSVRQALLNDLASVFQPIEPLAAELLLLSLISAPLSRSPGSSPLGTLSLNLITRADIRPLIQFIQDVCPFVVTLPLSISLLRDSRFLPKINDSGSLDAGLLQLGPGSILIVDETAMGEGGALDETALRNLNSLIDCIRSQTLTYQYPYMPDIKIDCALRVIVVSEAKSLLPVSTIPLSYTHLRWTFMCPYLRQSWIVRQYPPLRSMNIGLT